MVAHITLSLCFILLGSLHIHVPAAKGQPKWFKKPSTNSAPSSTPRSEPAAASAPREEAASPAEASGATVPSAPLEELGPFLGSRLVEIAPNSYAVVALTETRALWQKCGAVRPRGPEVGVAIEHCRKQSGALPLIIDRARFEQAFRASFRVPTVGEDLSLQEILLRAERGFRGSAEDLPYELSTSGEAFEAAFNALNTTFFEAPENLSLLPHSETILVDAVKFAFQSVYSDGDLVVRVTSPVNQEAARAGCAGLWHPLSLDVLLQSKRKLELLRWIRGQLAAPAPTVWLRHFYFKAQAIENETAYSLHPGLYGVVLNEPFEHWLIDQAPKVYGETLAELSAPQGVFYDLNQLGSRTYVSLCYRRIPLDSVRTAMGRNRSSADTDRLSLQQWWGRRFSAGVSGETLWYLLQAPEVVNAIGAEMLLENATIPIATLDGLKSRFDSLLRPELPRPEEVRKTLQLRKERAARERRLEQERIAEAREQAARERRREQERAAAQRQRERDEYQRLSDSTASNDGWRVNADGTRQRFRWSDGRWHSQPEPGTTEADYRVRQR